MPYDIGSILKDAVERGASDVHIKVGNLPLARIDGELGPIYDEGEKLMPPDTERMMRELLPEFRIKEFENNNEADFELTKFGRASNNFNVQTTVQPYFAQNHVRRFLISRTQSTYMCQFTWARTYTSFVIRVPWLNVLCG